jgi:hypothetical protein
MNERHPIEDELKARLTIGPSPGLQARIRANTSETIPKTIGWFPVGFGLAAASALALLLVILNSHTERPVVSTEVAAQAPVVVPVEIVPEPPPAIVPKAAKKEAPSPRLPMTAEASPSSTDLEVAKIELLPLRALDIPSALVPIPQAVFPTASLEPMKLEPFSLVPRVEGVNE